MQHATMRGWQAAILGDGIFPWNIRSVSVCWGCALKQHRQLSYRRSGTQSRGAKLGVKRRPSGDTTADSSCGQERLSIFNRSLTTGTGASWSDGRDSVTQTGGKPASGEISPFATPLDMPSHVSNLSRQLDEDGTRHERPNPTPEARSELQLPEPSWAESEIDTGLPESPLSWDRLRARNHRLKVMEDKERSEQNLNTALDSWSAHKNPSIRTPLHSPLESDATSITEEAGSCEGPRGHCWRGIPTYFAQSIVVQRVFHIHKHKAGKQRQTKFRPLLSVLARRSIQTASTVGEHRTQLV